MQIFEPLKQTVLVGRNQEHQKASNQENKTYFLTG